MKIVNCANCIIEIDVEKTKQFYSNFKVANTQANRNYQKYCEKMSTEEKAFLKPSVLILLSVTLFISELQEKRPCVVTVNM